MLRWPIMTLMVCLASGTLVAQGTSERFSSADSVAAVAAAVDTLRLGIKSPVHLAIGSASNELPSDMSAIANSALVLAVSKATAVDTMGLARAGETCEKTPSEELRGPRKCRYANTTSMITFEFLPSKPGSIKVRVIAATNSEKPTEGLERKAWDVTLAKGRSGWEIREVRLLGVMR